MRAIASYCHGVRIFPRCAKAAKFSTKSLLTNSNKINVIPKTVMVDALTNATRIWLRTHVS